MKFPHRVPGSKGWFVEHAERFVSGRKLQTIVEPFAGTAVVGLTLLERGLAKRLVLAEKDPELRNLMNVALRDPDFARRVTQFSYNLWELKAEKQREFAAKVAQRMKGKDRALSVLIRSLLAFNGILRDQISVQNGQQTRSWFPLDLGSSLKSLYDMRNKIEVLSDAFEALRRTDSADSYGFIDAPYTLSKHSPGHKLYRYGAVDHLALLRLLNHWNGSWQYTMEFCPKILRYVRDINFQPALLPMYAIPMQTTNGTKRMEVVLSRQAKDFGSRTQRSGKRRNAGQSVQSADVDDVGTPAAEKKAHARAFRREKRDSGWRQKRGSGQLVGDPGSSGGAGRTRSTKNSQKTGFRNRRRGRSVFPR